MLNMKANPRDVRIYMTPSIREFIIMFGIRLNENICVASFCVGFQTLTRAEARKAPPPGMWRKTKL